MKETDKGFLIFFSLIIIYIGSGYLQTLLGLTIGMVLKILLVGGYLLYFKTWFSFKLKFDWLAVLLGVGIAVIWVLLDPLYPHLTPVDTALSYSSLDIVLKLFIGVVLASVVEEFFTRSFLHRAIETKDWLRAPVGQYSLYAFLGTTAFFALSHSRWLPALITGVILNLIWYKRKDMNSIVLTHAVANLFLGIIVIFTGDFSFWS